MSILMKDSGVEWIGDIPENWKVARLKDVININMENIQNNFEQTKDIEEKYIHGITNYEDRIICILNIDSLVSE